MQTNLTTDDGKHVVITVPGSGERGHHDAVVTPGTTAADLLRGIGLAGYWLKKPRDDAFFGNDKSIYAAIQDGEKLEASSPAVVGTGGEAGTSDRPARRWWLHRFRPAPRPQPAVARQGATGATVVGPSKASYFDRQG